MTRPFQTYQRMAVSTADPLRIVVLLYEGAIKNLNQALPLIGPNPEQAAGRIARTLEIINYLRSALDHDKGGEIATNLERLYDYMRDVIAEANIQRDAGRLREVIGLLQTLLEGWRGISQPGNHTDGEEKPSPVTPLAGPVKSVSMVVG